MRTLKPGSGLFSFAVMKTEEQCVFAAQRRPRSTSHPPQKRQNNKAGDDDGRSYRGMARPTHLLVHHTVCTVILNEDQRETTGD